jgi:hypothetical protein
MAHYTDWLPSTREAQLEMCRGWISLLTAEKRTAWGIPADKFTALGNAFADAQALLQKATGSDRTATITAQCQAAFKVMPDTMRDFKKRFYLSPPLQNPADYVSLGLKPHDSTPTPSGTPTAQVTVETYLLFFLSLPSVVFPPPPCHSPRRRLLSNHENHRRERQPPEGLEHPYPGGGKPQGRRVEGRGNGTGQSLRF